ncbi:uncharacterized protein LOC101540921 [Sorex araneus]|uniref:uncharacterized protein LOC101540921 n=1 Tax=Sorex araneus TaxID=42254 RepID=UPI002433626C|nr:uncharacterized protein LOC101540921 [Sorex araneus]
MLPTMTFSSISWIMLSCLISLSQTQGIDFDKGMPSTKITCPIDSMLYSSYCYTLFMKPTTWMDANIVCQKRPSGSLASVLSKSEAAFVASLIRNNLDNNFDVWIGLHDPTEGRLHGAGWEWSSGDRLVYHAWESGGPSSQNFGYCGSVSEISAALHLAAQRVGPEGKDRKQVVRRLLERVHKYLELWKRGGKEMSHAHQKGDLIPAEELDAYGLITMALISFQSDTKSEEAPQSEPDSLFPEWMSLSYIIVNIAFCCHDQFVLDPAFLLGSVSSDTSPTSWMDANGLRPYGSGWEWSSTDLMNYNAWEVNPPIPYSGYCGSVTKNSDFLKWKDNNCDAKLPYVCKFKY